jgi:putative transcriptional regulator
MDIKEIRIKMMYSQVEFAKKLGIALATLQSWEQGRAEPSLRMKRKVAEFCKINNIEIY